MNTYDKICLWFYRHKNLELKFEEGYTTGNQTSLDYVQGYINLRELATFLDNPIEPDDLLQQDIPF